jgi:hypothetical protein
MGVSLLRSAVLLPGALFAAHLAWSGAASVGPLAPLAPGLAATGAAAGLLAPQTLSVLAGLLLSGWLLSAALRGVYLAGALPTLGETLSGSPPRHAFASGVAFGFPRVAGAALVAFGLELAGVAAGLAALLGTGLVARALASRTAPGWSAPLAAAVAAAALTLAALCFTALSAVGDAALARAALRQEPAHRAAARALVRFGQRPAAFLALILATAAVQGALAGGVRAALALPSGVAPPRALALSLAAQLAASAAAALLGAAVELWRLGAVAVLACQREPAGA